MCLGVPGRIVAIEDEQRKLGVIECAGVRRIVSLHMVAESDQALADLVGTWALIHVGFAMSTIDEDEAHRTLALLAELGEMAEMEELGEAGEEARGEPGGGAT